MEDSGGEAGGSDASCLKAQTWVAANLPQTNHCVACASLHYLFMPILGHSGLFIMNIHMIGIEFDNAKQNQIYVCERTIVSHALVKKKKRTWTASWTLRVFTSDQLPCCLATYDFSSPMEIKCNQSASQRPHIHPFTPTKESCCQSKCCPPLWIQFGWVSCPRTQQTGRKWNHHLNHQPLGC